MRSTTILIFSLLLITACNSSQKRQKEGQSKDSASYDEQSMQGNIQMDASHSSEQVVSSIAFGSCGSQDKPHPVLQTAANHNPDLWVYLGDNIYGDTKNMDTLRMKYQKLAEKPGFQAIRDSALMLATWDDHDYGWNDAGRHYEYKEESKEIMLNFFNEPKGSDRWKHDGIYTSYMFGREDKKLQLIILDVRTFRDCIKPYNGNRDGQEGYDYDMAYSPYKEDDSTMLGKQQWDWLGKQLEMDADVRIIASSTQFGITHNGYEAWANFPHEKQKMLNLIKEKQAQGIMFISGDVHYSEISKQPVEGGYPIFDHTASGLTHIWDFATPNDNRLVDALMKEHFGKIEIDWSQEDPLITMKSITEKDSVGLQHQVRLSELSF